MGLDEGQQKHWAYKLKREYEAQAKLEKRMEERQAKKDYRKMLKKFGIKRELEDLEDYESFYNKTDSKAQKSESDSDDESFIHFSNEREKQFYNNG